MAAGGTWTSQNKVRPGAYIRFRTNKAVGLTVGERGTVTIAKSLPWGEMGKAVTFTPDEDPTAYTGYKITDASNLWLQEMTKGSNRTDAPTKIILYRLKATDAAKASATVGSLTVTALYEGSRGNDIAIIVSKNTDGTFEISTVVDGEIKDAQTTKTTPDANAWVSFSGTPDEDTVKESLSGGEDGTVSASAYADYLTAVEPMKFDVLVYDGSDATVKKSIDSFIKRRVNNAGLYSQAVYAGESKPDSQYIIEVSGGVKLEDGTVLTAEQTCWWVGGATAGAKYNQSLTAATYTGATELTKPLTQTEYEDAINGGLFVFNEDDGVIRVEKDINTLISYTVETGKVFNSNRVIRLCSTIANDLRAQFNAYYIGVVNNNEEGRAQFKSAVAKYMVEIQANNGIQNFDSEEDIEVLAGEDADAVVVNLAIQPVDSIQKIYMSVDVS